MKGFTKLLTILLFFTCINTYAQKSDGINFFDGSWEEALAEAQKTNKPIFLDAYASWCKPCKMMNKEVFPQTNVGNYFNENYVSIKIDMEKGEGPEIAKKYGVKVFPTFFFINPQGEALHKSAGYQVPDKFIQLAKDAKDENKQYFALKTQYDAGDKSPAVLYNYAMAMYGSDAYYESAPVAEEYLQSLGKKELKSEKTMDIVMKIPIAHDGFAAQQLLENRKKYEKTFTAEKIDNKLLGMMKSKVSKAAKANDVTALKEATDFVSANIPAKADKWNAKLSMSFFERTNNWEGYADVASKYVEAHAMDDSETLNMIAWTYFESVEEKAQLQEAVKWVNRAIELEHNYYNTDTKAALLYKLEQYEDALTASKVAIEAAKKEDTDPKETLSLVTKITKDSGLGLDYILANKEQMMASFGEKDATKSIKGLLYNASHRAGEAKNFKDLQSTIALAREFNPKKAEFMTASLTLEYYEKAENWDKYVSTATTYIEDEGGMDDWYMLNTVAWGFYEKIDDKALLKKALAWSNRSVELEKNYYNTDTKAALLYKLGNHQDALAAAKIALELAEKEGIEAKDTQELMKKLENLEP
ncbi:MAG: thioredoxin family protein [Chitinophagales bacterium]